MRRTLGAALAALLVAAAACARKPQTPAIQIALVTRRDIIVDAQGNGNIEPITIVDVKSKASGVITKMPVETGTHVKPGDLVVQIDTRDVQNRYDQAKAALDAAQAKLQVAESEKKRNEEMFKARVITPQEFEQIAVNYENAKSGVVSASANLDLAKQSLEEATVKAPSEGTIITKNVSQGTVIASATGSVSGGTTIVQMADLTVVRIRAYFNESDIGNVHAGEPANVTVDAYPDRRFSGVVEKIEPQAVVQQNVTMFPVLVNLDNREGLLKPGMNGEVSVLIDERDNVLAIPNDAIKNPREAVATGAMLGLSSDTVQAELRAQGFGGGGMGGRGKRGGNGGGNGGRQGAGNGAGGSAGGDVALIQQGGGQQGGGGFQGGRGGFQTQVSDADCKKVDDALKAHAKERKQLDSLRARMQALRGGGGGGGPSPEMQAIRAQMSAVYTALNLDPRVAGGCLRRQQGSLGGPGGDARQLAGRQGGDSARGSRTGNPRSQGGSRGQGALTPSPEMGGRAQRTRPGLVYVTDSTKTLFHPRIVQLGQGNLDYTEVVSGLKEGDRVIMLGALALQAQRLQNQDRFRQNASPLGGGQPGPAGPRGGGGRGG